MRSLANMLLELFRAVAVRVWRWVEYIRYSKRRQRMFWSLLLVAFLLFSFWEALLSPPSSFPTNALVKIKKGSTLSEVAQQLTQAHVVRSNLLLKLLVIGSSGQRGVVAGTYIFHRPASAFSVARIIVTGSYGLELRRVTVPEGTNVKEVAKILKGALTDFDEDRFISIASAYEGYLFPDTYFFYEDAEPEQMVQTMRDNFSMQVSKIAPEITKSGHTLSEVIIMASILEEEARTEDSRRTIAGILWKRLSKGMPLQVDAVFVYLLGKGSLQLSKTDLATDSPYNTYTHKGLPPTPISSPGLSSIQNAIQPIATSYYFYLSDRNGEMHYAATFEQHKANKAAYLP